LGIEFRLGLIFVFSLLFAVLEAIWPYRLPLVQRRKRWPGNASLLLLNVLAVALPANFIVLWILHWGGLNNIGLLNYVPIPVAIKALIGVLALDAMYYFQHRLSHRIPFLWRLHSVHHADPYMDVTTTGRLHPLEFLWISFLRIGFAVVIGIPEIGMVAFLIVFNGFTIFSHANLSLPSGFERALRLLIVTPRMHETHHSMHPSDFDTNFSSVFSFWDRLFGTHKRYATKFETGVKLGLEDFRDLREFRLHRLLSMPFRAAN
jgi:sterol desaturase/sphingolipid hydroxylase (fatty acid hydroxylase superfamily)